MLQVILPLAFILGAIDVLVDSWAIGFVIRPETIIDVSVDMDELTFAVGSVFPPLSDILGAIRPRLFTKSISEAALPLASVNGTG